MILHFAFIVPLFKNSPFKQLHWKFQAHFFPLFFFFLNSRFERWDKSSTKCQDRQSATIVHYYPDKGYVEELALEQILLLLKVIDFFSSSFQRNEIGPFWSMFCNSKIDGTVDCIKSRGTKTAGCVFSNWVNILCKPWFIFTPLTNHIYNGYKATRISDQNQFYHYLSL